jgi:membrane protein DedA with SNARE-associated domain
MSFKGLLFLPFVIATALCADFLGTNILYFIFYTTGTIILKKRPKWLPISDNMIDRLTTKISSGGQLSIYIFRLTPFTRGYASVITGLLHIKPKVFLPIAVISAGTWASVYVLIGNLIGPSWDMFATHIGSFNFLLLVVMAVTVSLTLFVNYRRSRRKKKKCDDDNSFSSIVSGN